jgi:hypothetical protein
VINPRAIATLGIGYIPSISARLGLWEMPPTTEVITLAEEGMGFRSKTRKRKIDDLDEDFIEFITVFTLFRSL